jgi:hypothetical protein
MGTIVFTVWIAWLSFLASAQLNFLSNYIVTIIESFSEGFLTSIPITTIRNPTPDFVFHVQAMTVLTVLELLAFSLTIIALHFNHYDRFMKMVILSVFFGGFIPMNILSVFGEGALFSRFLLYVLPIIPITLVIMIGVNARRPRSSSIMKSLRERTPSNLSKLSAAIILILCILSITIYPITSYAGDSFEFRSDATITSRQFLINHVSGFDNATGREIVSGKMGTFQSMDYHIFSFYQLRNQSGNAYYDSFENGLFSARTYDSGDTAVYMR